MRSFFCLLALLAPALALAGNSYSPRFARDEQPAEVLSFDLCPKPVYPRSSLRNEEQGTVALRFTIAPTGRVLKQQILRSSGFRELDRAGMEALSRCYFRPASIDGQPVQSPMDIQYKWTLD
jgi:protein TonB